MIAIIPARGGSRGLPRKNIKNLCGKPIISYTIDAAKKSRHISDVIISTDDQEISEIALANGATCPFLRPKQLATDSALAIDNYNFTIEKLNIEYGYDIKNFIVLQPTSPLRITEDIDNSISLFIDKNADSVISYTEESHPVIWHKYIDEKGSFENIFDETFANRQDNRISYYPNGAIMVFKFDLIKSGQYYSDKSYAYIMPKNRSIDIDCIDDFKYAEYLLGNKIAKK